MTAFMGLFFGTLLVAAALSMAKIRRQELLDARQAEQTKKARIEAFRAKCYRPDGD